MSWIKNHPETINEDWYYFKWPHSETREPPTHRQRKVDNFLEIQSVQNGVWVTIKYLSLVKEQA